MRGGPISHFASNFPRSSQRRLRKSRCSRRGPPIHGDKSTRFMVATLMNGKSYDIDPSDDGDESLQIDPGMLKQVLAAED